MTIDEAAVAAAPSPPDNARLRRLIELESLLDDIRVRCPAAPQWEFCEGFMAALLCGRRPVAPEEYLPVLFGVLEPEAESEQAASLVLNALFADAAQRERFLQLWNERWIEVAAALAAGDKIESLDDERAYQPEISDLHGLLAALPAEQRSEIEAGGGVPAFAQLWALGFLEVVDCWAEDWAPPRERATRELIEECVATIEALADDDTGPPELSPFSDDEPPSVSARRFDEFGDALWAVYDLHRTWRALGPRSVPLRKAAQPGRNDPCWCGSGRKFKKCHGV